MGNGTAGLPGKGGGTPLAEPGGIDAEHLDFPCKSALKKEFCGGAINSSFESFTGGRSKALRTLQIEEIVKFESPGQNAVE